MQNFKRLLAEAQTNRNLCKSDTSPRAAYLDGRIDALTDVLRDITQLDPNGPLRMYIALQILRAWHYGTQGYGAVVVETVFQWIDGGMKGPVPWPDSPFFARWAESRGYSNVDGAVGFYLSFQLGGDDE